MLQRLLHYLTIEINDINNLLIKLNVFFNNKNVLNRARNAQNKRKWKKNLNQNSHNKKIKTRLNKFLPLKKKVEMIKTTNRIILYRIIQIVKIKFEYANIIATIKQQMLEIVKNNLNLKKYALNVCTWCNNFCINR